MPLLLTNIHSFIRVALHVNTQQAQVDGQVRGASLGQALPRRAPQQEERQARCVTVLLLLCCYSYSIIQNSSTHTHIYMEMVFKQCFCRNTVFLLMKNCPFSSCLVYFLKRGTHKILLIRGLSSNNGVGSSTITKPILGTQLRSFVLCKDPDA